MGVLAEKAVANHKKKYNCAQAVACAFCDKLGRDEKEVFEVMEAFGDLRSSFSNGCGRRHGGIRRSS